MSSIHVTGRLNFNAWAFLAVTLLIPAIGKSAAEQPTQDNPAEPPHTIFGLGWLDSTQSAASDSANALANRLDRFFGVQRSDIEAAYSALRVATIYSWNEQDHHDTGMRLRGKLYLPRVNERVSLVFSEEDGDGTTYYTTNPASVAGKETTRASLEVNLANKDAHHLFMRVGLRSGLKGQISTRYRYDPGSRGSIANRFTQSVYFKDGKGFGTFSRYQLDLALSSESLLRWTNDLRLEESYSGVKYTSLLEYLALRSNNTAMSLYTRINGETKPDFIVSYDLGLRYRKNIYRKWLYMEIEPGYSWQKEDYGLPRKGMAYVFLRLEMAVGTFN